MDVASCWYSLRFGQERSHKQPVAWPVLPVSSSLAPWGTLWPKWQNFQMWSFVGRFRRGHQHPENCISSFWHFRKTNTDEDAWVLWEPKKPRKILLERAFACCRAGFFSNYFCTFVIQWSTSSKSTSSRTHESCFGTVQNKQFGRGELRVCYRKRLENQFAPLMKIIIWEWFGQCFHYSTLSAICRLCWLLHKPRKLFARGTEFAFHKPLLRSLERKTPRQKKKNKQFRRGVSFDPGSTSHTTSRSFQ